MLGKLEAALQSALEGVARLLPGKLHPLELAAQLRSAMDSSQRIITEAGYVGNVYRIQLSPEDLGPLAELKADIEAELAGHLREYAAQREYGCSPQLTVKIDEDTKMAPGTAKVTAHFDRSPLPAVMQVVDGLPPQIFDVTDTVAVGRATECEIQLPDPTVSRHHARLEWTYPGWVLRDLGSNNGTQVNGQLITQELLSNNDLVQLGEVQLRFSFRVEWTSTAGGTVARDDR